MRSDKEFPGDDPDKTFAAKMELGQFYYGRMEVGVDGEGVARFLNEAGIPIATPPGPVFRAAGAAAASVPTNGFLAPA